MKGTIRRLGEEDARAFRKLWFSALRSEPEEFSTNAPAPRNRVLAYFRRLVKEGVVFGSFSGERMTGAIGLRGQDQPFSGHKADIVLMFVRDSARGTGVAIELLDVIEEYARKHFEVINVRVIDRNRRARRFLDREGYKLYGLERRAVKAKTRYYDEEMRAKRLL
ncbi:MAG: GNAT family N-acetyltransferase [Alphaproteobacteria bacterium]|nr:GNAT family N-acetyltransferase [Alphaproteobacteria bacterium]